MSIESRPDQAVRDIRDLLEHQYKDESFVRELMQNADDAGAGRLCLELRQDGLAGVQNPLLRGPLLLIANDGPLRPEDAKALHYATGGNKATEVAKVGRFGLGLKSIFHWCEAFVYYGQDVGGVEAIGVVNPYVRETEQGRCDPIFPAWEQINSDQGKLKACLHEMLPAQGPTQPGLLLCVPLRVPAHLQRGDMRLAEWTWPPVPTARLPWALDDDRALAEVVLVLAQCTSLSSLVSRWSGGSFEVALQSTETAQRLSRPGGPASTNDRSRQQPTALRSTIVVRPSSGKDWSVEVSGQEQTVSHLPELEELRERPDWPKDMIEVRDGRYENRKRKAVPHAAVSVIRWPTDRTLGARVALRWAAFLPLEGKYEVDGSQSAKREPASRSFDVVMHGYFFPKPDRKNLEGLTTGSNELVGEWNRQLAQSGCLPLLPSSLATAFSSLPIRDAKEALDAAGRALQALTEGHIRTKEVASKSLLLPRVDHGTAQYQAIADIDVASARPLCSWAQAEGVQWLATRCRSAAQRQGLLFYDESLCVELFAPKEKRPRWQFKEAHLLLNDLLDNIPKANSGEVTALVNFVSSTFNQDVVEPSDCAESLLGWVHVLQSEGWGPHGHKWKQEQQAATVASTLLCWLESYGVAVVEVSRGAKPAVERLAKLTPPSLLLVPSGGSARASNDRAEKASLETLPELAHQIECAYNGDSKSDLGPKSWQILARDLVAVVGLERVLVDPDLKNLKLIPVYDPHANATARLVSAACLRERADRQMLFRPSSNKSDDIEFEKSDKALIDSLASALGDGQRPWLVNLNDGRANALDERSVAGVLLNQTANFQPDVSKRLQLLKRLCKQEDSPELKRAIRLLAHGQVQHKNDMAELWSADDRADQTAQVAALCLRHQNGLWRLVDPTVREALSKSQSDSIGLKLPEQADLIEVLKSIADDVCGDQMSVEERTAVLSLVARVGNKDLFCNLPLHEVISGENGLRFCALKERRTFRTGVAIPPALETGVTIIADSADPNIRDAYGQWLAEFDNVALIEALLVPEKPHQHAALIAQTITSLNFPRDKGSSRDALTKNLRDFEWLPLDDGSGISPRDVVQDDGLNEEASKLLKQLRTESECRFALGSELDDACMGMDWRDVWELLNRWKLIAPFAGALVDVLQRNHNRLPADWQVGPANWSPTDRQLEVLLQLRSLRNASKGWALLQALFGTSEQTDVKAARAMLEALQGIYVPWSRLLNTLAEGQQNREVCEETWFALANLVPDSQISTILPELKVLCADSKWRNTKDVSRHLTRDLPKRVLPHDKTVQWLKLADGGQERLPTSTPTVFREQVSAQVLLDQIEVWVGRSVGRPMLAAAMFWTGSKEMENLISQKWLSATNQPIRGTMPGEWSRPGREVEFFLSKSKQDRRVIESLCGSSFEIPAEGTATSLLEHPPAPGATIKYVFRELKFEQLHSDQRKAVLRDTAHQFAVAVLGRPRANALFPQWWKSYGESSQLSLKPVREMLLKEMRGRLEELRVDADAELSQLQDVVAELLTLEVQEDKADRQQQMRERLAELLADQRTGSRVRELVRKHLGQEAYSEASVLLELWQNADDALEELQAIRAGDLPPDAGVVKVEIAEWRENQVLQFTHRGRLINDDGGTSFPEGRRRGWQIDLYNMLRLRISGKKGAAHAGTGMETTGYFGLGFKSVHFVSDCPVVSSGDLNFRIDAALLPNEVLDAGLPKPAEEIESLPPTTISLSLRDDREPDELLREMFRRVQPLAGLLPAMSRQVHTLALPAQYGGEVCFKPVPIPDATGWSVGEGELMLDGDRGWQLLRYRTTTGGHSSLRSLVVGLKGGTPTRFPQEVPTFWTVAPTQERWDIGYALNDAFRLNTGRVNVQFGDSDELLASLGEALGTALCELVSCVLGSQAIGPLAVADPKLFVAALWRTLAGGLRDDTPKERREVLLQLHGAERGLSAVARRLKAVPSGLAEPWPSLVGPVGPQAKVYRVSEQVNSPALRPLLTAIPELLPASIAVSLEVAEVLAAILDVKPVDFDVVQMLGKWSSERHNEVEPEWLDRLACLSDDGCFAALRGLDTGARVDDWLKQLRFRATDRSVQQSSVLVLPTGAAKLKMDLGSAPDSFDDELLRAAFAPKAALLAIEYCTTARRVETFLTLRGTLDADAKRLADWAFRADQSSRTEVARYLAEGKLSPAVAAQLQRQLPPWLDSRGKWQALATQAGLNESRTQQVEIDLFGPISRTPTGSLPPLTEPEAVRPEPLSNDEAKSRLLDLWNSWSREAYRKTKLSELRKELWPRTWKEEQISAWLKGNLSDPDTKRAWMTLFLLAHVQGLGLGGRNGTQHRSFVESLQQSRSKDGDRGPTWWDQLFGDGAPDGTWMAFLDAWSREHPTGRTRYDYWMRVLPDAYAATKWWRVYAESLRFGHAVGNALTPAANSDLAGDPESSDVPAMHGALGRIEWIREELKFFGVAAAAKSSNAELYMPSPKLTDVLQWLGYPRLDDGDSYRGEEVFRWIGQVIGRDKADFHGLGKLPLELDLWPVVR